MGKMLAGTFNAEKFWRDTDLAELPRLEDRNFGHLVLSMDELLFPFASGPEDTLITLFGFDETLAGYLHENGFGFTPNRFPFAFREPENQDLTVFDHLADPSSIGILAGSDLPDSLDIYAVVPGLESFCRSSGIPYHFPGFDTVRRVNSKYYSHKLIRELGLGDYGHIVNSCSGLRETVTRMYDFGKGFLIKDLMGVSGNGNQFFNSARLFDKIVQFLEKQESSGARIQFLLEPCFDKESDFSCQLMVPETGPVQLVSIQRIYNNKFTYLGAVTAEPSFLQWLGDRGYLDTVVRVGEQLRKDGYRGEVCIDSMILKGGTIIPIVEINARKSMGLINFRIDNRLEPFGVKSLFSSVNVGYRKGENCFQGLLDTLEGNGLLFGTQSPTGILPLSANTLFVPEGFNPGISADEFCKGRFYYSAVSGNLEDQLALQQRLKDVLKSMAFTVYN
jgi:hypothetical protein